MTFNISFCSTVFFSRAFLCFGEHSAVCWNFSKFFLFQGSQITISVITPAKGRKSITRFRATAKGGEKMKDSYEQRVQNQFGGFCNRVLKNEVNRIMNESAR